MTLGGAYTLFTCIWKMCKWKSIFRCAFQKKNCLHCTTLAYHNKGKNTKNKNLKNTPCLHLKKKKKNDNFNETFMATIIFCHIIIWTCQICKTCIFCKACMLRKWHFCTTSQSNLDQWSKHRQYTIVVSASSPCFDSGIQYSFRRCVIMPPPYHITVETKKARKMRQWRRQS